MGYEYGFEEFLPEFGGAMAGEMAMGAASVITGVVLLLWFLAFGFGVVCYVLNAVGMYRIAKRRGIHHAWLAWVPVGCNWLLGSISDHYQYVAKQKVTSKRKILLILTLVMAAVCLVFIGGGIGVAMSADAIATSVGLGVSVALMGLAYLAMTGLAIAITVFCYIAYYDLFRSSKPGNAVLFMVLSIVFNVTLAFFVFACGNSDAGMPVRRKSQSTPQIPCEPEAPAEDAEPMEEIPVVEAEIVEDPE